MMRRRLGHKPNLDTQEPRGLELLGGLYQECCAVPTLPLPAPVASYPFLPGCSTVCVRRGVDELGLNRDHVIDLMPLSYFPSPALFGGHGRCSDQPIPTR